jgi:transcriptional regulator with XRE-family HTH domain
LELFDMITPEQCRAARGLLSWSQDELRVRASMSRRTIIEFELGLRQAYPRTLADLRRTFEEAGVVFLDANDGVHTPGVALKWGVEIPRRSEGTQQPTEDGVGGLKALDREMADYWAERPEQWARLSETGRQVLSTEMFGDGFAADEAFGHIAG